MTNAAKARPWVIRWMYGVVAVHLLVGILLPWIGDLALFEGYHRGIESAFWKQEAPQSARAQQVWWIGLFGPTVQAMSLWMGALLHIGARQRSASAWLWLIAGIVVWAPQDMLVSLRADAWIHVWIDSLALVTMLPPLAWLWLHDRKRIHATHSFETSLSREPL